jgi:hypothetical protein
MLNDSETLPVGQTLTPRQLRILKASVIIMGVLIVLGFGLLLVGLYLQTSKLGSKTPAPVFASAPQQPGGRPPLPIVIEPGAELHEAFADQGRLILHLKRQGESEFAVIDLATGRETQRITVAPRR